MIEYYGFGVNKMQKTLTKTTENQQLRPVFCTFFSAILDKKMQSIW